MRDGAATCTTQYVVQIRFEFFTPVMSRKCQSPQRRIWRIMPVFFNYLAKYIKILRLSDRAKVTMTSHRCKPELSSVVACAWVTVISVSGKLTRAVRSSEVDLAPVAQPYHRNRDVRVLDPADQPPIVNTILPEFTQFAALEGLADRARVIYHRHPIPQKRDDAPGDHSVQFWKLLFSGLRDLNPPDQAVPPHHPARPSAPCLPGCA